MDPNTPLSDDLSYVSLGYPPSWWDGTRGNFFLPLFAQLIALLCAFFSPTVPLHSHLVTESLAIIHHRCSWSVNSLGRFMINPEEFSENTNSLAHSWMGCEFELLRSGATLIHLLYWCYLALTTMLLPSFVHVQRQRIVNCHVCLVKRAPTLLLQDH